MVKGIVYVMEKSHVALALTVVLLGLAGTSGALAPPEDNLDLSAGNATITPGDTATVTLAVTNTGNETVGGNYTLVANDSRLPAGWEVTITNATVVRGPITGNETVTTTLSLSVPANATPGEVSVPVALVSGDKEWANATAIVTVTAEVSNSTTTTNRDDDTDDGEERAMETTANVSSGGGVAVGVVGASDSSGVVGQILELVFSRIGIGVLAVIAIAAWLDRR